MKNTCKLCEYYNKLKHGDYYCEYWCTVLYDADEERCEEFRIDPDTIQSCRFCSNALEPETENALVFCTRMETMLPQNSWCENFEKDNKKIEAEE